MTDKDQIYMREALREAKLAEEEGEIPIGAVVVCRDRIIAKGHNMTERLSDPTAHAEMIALTSACSAVGGKYLDGCTLYVTVEPCPMCAAALAWAQISTIVYGAADPKRGYSLFSAPTLGTSATGPGSAPSPAAAVPAAAASAKSRTLLHPKTTVRSGVLASECGALVSDFFKKMR